MILQYSSISTHPTLLMGNEVGHLLSVLPLDGQEEKKQHPLFSDPSFHHPSFNYTTLSSTRQVGGRAARTNQSLPLPSSQTQ
ncbi:hypothetical protein E2C01_028332 [Portunus trituberculatus]|uniref:Uncharacterized protein n=1 Tax=Portunus trituberculatus TaxID=210409 RepID=A0A5B7ENS8_PORTR|nr:hypothetical protein [Portunus trituberculatus]